jgi:sugar-specific transcriptional regulator TrmB
VTDPIAATDGNDDVDLDAEAIERILVDLGLSSYEAAVFVALQRIGVATAEELATLSEVPRSQVYGATEGLSSKGLVHTQPTTPKRYRPVDVGTARDQLWAPFCRRSERAFETLSRVATQPAPDGTDREDVWLLRGVPATTARIEDLVVAADRSVLLGVGHPTLLSEGVVESVATAAAAGVDVQVVSQDDSLLTRFDATGATCHHVSRREEASATAGRVLVVDDDAVLVSALGAEETAVWTANTSVAALLINIVESALAEVLPK